MRVAGSFLRGVVFAIASASAVPIGSQNSTTNSSLVTATTPPPTTPQLTEVAQLTPEKSPETNSSSISNASSNAPSLFFITSSMLVALILAT